MKTSKFKPIFKGDYVRYSCVNMLEIVRTVTVVIILGIQITILLHSYGVL